MDPKRVRKKVLLDLIASPGTLLPAALGATALAVGWAVDQGGAAWAFGGLCGILAGAGVLATRWVFGLEELVARAMSDITVEDTKNRQKTLDLLDARLRKDEDQRPEGWLAELRDLHREFEQDQAWREGLDERTRMEISSKIENLFQACIMSLQRSQEFMELAQRMTTRERRREILEARERLLTEIEGSVKQLGRSIDDVRLLKIDRQGDERLARLRSDLDESLEVARRVDERMRTLDVEIGSRDGESPVKQ